jgi:uncharacterized protein (DUF58 family)
MISLLPIVLVLALIAALLRVSFVLNALYVVGGLYLLATLWSAGTRRGVAVRRLYEPRAMLGDTLTVRLEVENRGLWPVPWARVHERLPIAIAVPPYFVGLVSLWPRGRATLSYVLHCRQRGYYALGGLDVTSGDVFGLRAQAYELAGISYLTVYPRIVSLDELGLPSKSPFGHLRALEPLYEDPARVVGVRDYQSGDSLRRINWKTTAAVGRLQVRRLEPAMTLQTVLLVNLSLDEYERQDAYYATEQAIVVAASIANHLIGLRQEVGLVTNGKDPLGGSLAGIAVRKGRGHLIGILEILGRIDQTSGNDFCSMLRAQMGRLPWGATLVVLTGTERPELWESLLALRRAGFSVVVVFCDYPSLVGYNQARGRGESLGFRCYRVWKTEDMDAWRRRSPIQR